MSHPAPPTASQSAEPSQLAEPSPAGPSQLAKPDGGSDEEVATRLRVAIIRLHRRLRQQSLAGITPAQASALGSVNRLGTPTLGELAAVEQVQPPTMTKLAAQMEEAGLLTRLADDVDRRVVRVKAMPLGRRTVERIRRLERDYLATQLASLEPTEQAAASELVALLEHLLGNGRTEHGRTGNGRTEPGRPEDSR